MALALSKQVHAQLVLLRDAILTMRATVPGVRAFLADNTAAITAWPNDADGKLTGYGVTKAQLVQVKALLDALVTLHGEHGTALAVIEEVS